MLRYRPVAESDWRVSGRDPDVLLDAALVELTDDSNQAAALELGVLGGWALVTTEFMQRERVRSRNKSSLDRVLSVLVRTEHGLHILYEALTALREGRSPERVTETGEVDLTADSDWTTNDDWLRDQVFPPEPQRPIEPIDEEAASPPEAQLDNAKAVVVGLVNGLREAMREVRLVEGDRLAEDDSSPRPLVRERGWPPAEANELIRQLEDDVIRPLRRYAAVFEAASDDLNLD
jgi:hypothetical protein